MDREILILPARNCRRSRKVIAFLQSHGIPFRQIELETPEGQQYAQRYEMRASPGIVVDGVSINPYDILLQKECRVDEGKALSLFLNQEKLD